MWNWGAGMTYTPAANGLHVLYEAPIRQEYTLVFDGKEHPAENRANETLTARKINERSFEEKWTRNGKLSTTSTITVSPDGQELIEQHQPSEATGEPSTYVYRRAK
jgi:DNA-binding PadR family transcriptional regulator